MARRGLIAYVAAAIAAAAWLAGCGNPADLMDAAKNEVKAAKDLFLLVKGVSPASSASEVNPNAAILIDFDRDLDSSTITAANVVVAPSSDPSSPATAILSYSATLRRLTIEPAVLEGGATYIVTLGTGLLSTEGESLQEDYSWSFTTAALPGGTIYINGDAAYVNMYTGSVLLNISANSLVDGYHYSETESAVAGLSWDPLPAGFPKTQAITLSGEGLHTVYYQFKSGAGAISEIMSDSIIVDTVAPSIPVVTGPSSTTSHYPAWSWTAGGGGNGVFQYSLNSTSAWSSETTALGYAPSAGLADGSWTLRVRERDDAGNWSNYPSAPITIDAPPGTPTVARVSSSPTLDATPTWSWTSGGFGNGTYRYQLDSTAGTWTETTGLSYTPSSDLADGLHYLYAEERDAGGEWSTTYGYASIRTTAVIPYLKAKASSIPALSWRATKGATYIVQIYDSENAKWVALTKSISTNSYQVTKAQAFTVGATVYWRVSVSSGSAYIPSSSGSYFLVVE